MNDWCRGLAVALMAGLVASCSGGPKEFPVLEHDDGSAPRDVTGADGHGDVPGAFDTPEPGLDVPATSDVGAPDVATDSEGPGPDVPGPDTDEPELRSAFSNKQGVVTARFSEPVGAGAEDADNYTIRASNNQVLPVLGATRHAEAPRFVDLQVDASAINPDLSYELSVKDVEDEAGNVIALGKHKAKVTRTLFLNIVWHQHQPLYLDPDADTLTGPWVRKHATKDYYDMVSILEGYPDVHFNVNLTSVLLRQLIEYYVERLDPFIDVHANTMDVEGFLEAWAGRTDPFVDFLLEDTPTAETITEEELDLVWKGPWTLVSTSDAIMRHFPEYIALRDANRTEYDHDDFLALKIWFEIAWFDPDFLDGPVELPDGSVTRVHEWLDRSVGDDGQARYTLAVEPSEQLAVDLLIENHKVMRNTIPIHQELFYDAATGAGQVEVTTTPMYHPILPLIYDTDLMGQSQPFDPRPEPAFSFPGDAAAQVWRAVRFYEDIFGVKPRGIWCGEGSVAEEIVPLLVDAGLEWTATDHEVLKRSLNDDDAPVFRPYRVDADTSPGHAGDESDSMLIVFRHTDLSDRMGFEYKTWDGDAAAQDFIDDLAHLAPGLGGEDRLLTVVLDGENAWEAYTQEHDAKGFHHALYQKLSQAYDTGEIVTVTTSEFIHGNPQRAIDPHPIAEQQELEPLWAGSWIGGTFATWIGEVEENKAWEYLRRTRADLAASGLPRPNPLAAAPDPSEALPWAIYQAWDLMYAAEGSDWFWWYGVDQTTPSNDDSPFDRAFRSQLLGVYEHMNEALALMGEPPLDVPEFAPLIQAKPKGLEGPYGGEDPAPTVDGAFVPSEAEWTPPGGFFFDSDSSTAINNKDDIGTVYYGWDPEAFYVAVQANEDLHAKLGTPYSLSVLVDHKHILDAETGTAEQDPAHPYTPPGEEAPSMDVARRVRVDFSGDAPEARLEDSDGSGGWSGVAGHGVDLGGPQFGGMVVELRVPWSDLGLVPVDDPLSFHVVATEGDEDVDAAPSFSAKRVFDDVTNRVFVTFECDATGEQIPVEPIGLKEPPPPLGDGVVFIVGKDDKLGDWVPNKVALSDSGKSGDEVAGDNVWTGTFGFPRGEVLQYKYTVGTGTFEGQWAGTEEFPYTNRQYVVPEDPAVTRVILRDVLGDDPPNENSLGKLTEVTEIEE
ncbi:MAG: carbohydrate-binding module family 20 domain-containing protein [Myxococcota bacterium]